MLAAGEMPLKNWAEDLQVVLRKLLSLRRSPIHFRPLETVSPMPSLAPMRGLFSVLEAASEPLGISAPTIARLAPTEERPMTVHACQFCWLCRFSVISLK